MGSKKSNHKHKLLDEAEDGNAPRNAAELLSSRYQHRRDGDAVGVPYSEWAALADHYWQICGRMGPAMPCPPCDKPDALPIYPEAALDALQGDGGKEPIQTRCIWIYPKV